MVVLVAGERQAEALDRVADEADRPVMPRRLLEGLQQRGQVMPAEIAHQRRELGVRTSLDQPCRRSLVADVVEQAPAPCRAALEGQRGIELVGAAVDPVAQALSARLREGGLLELAMLHDHHVPAEIGEHGLKLGPEAFPDHSIQRLAVVVDDPPGVAKPVLPALDQRLVDVALVHLGVADERDHAPFRAVLHPAMGLAVILRQRGEQRLRHAKAHRAGREIDVVHVLGARGIGLRALVAAEVLQLCARLIARQILDGVEDGRRVRLHRHAVLGLESAEIEGRHDGGERGGGSLMPADLHLA